MNPISVEGRLYIIKSKYSNYVRLFEFLKYLAL